MNIENISVPSAVSYYEKESNLEEVKLITDINQAILEINNARNIFDNVEDFDLIELAIYSENLAKKRYEYLLRTAKNMDIQVSNRYIVQQCGALF